MMIPLSKPALGDEEARAASEAILSGWVTQGPRVRAFEEAFAGCVGARHACAVSSGTTALHLALLAVGVQPGDVVVTVSHSFIATANVVRHCGAEPVFIDIDPSTFNMDPGQLDRFLTEQCVFRKEGLFFRDIGRIAAGESPLRRLISEMGTSPAGMGRVSAILPVHQMGIPCEIGRIVEIAERYSIPIVEDAACAIGSEVSVDVGANWERIGKPHGDIACFSFHPRKVLTTGDGGMLTTNRSDYDERFRLLRQHGMSVSDVIRHDANRVIIEEYLCTGFNYRMTDIQAAVGIEQLGKLDRFLAERRELAAVYEASLTGLRGIEVFRPGERVRVNWQSYPVKLADEMTLTQVEVMQHLLDHGIASRRGIMNAHKEQAYRDAAWILPRSEECRNWTILLPLYNGMTKDSAVHVAETLRKIAA